MWDDELWPSAEVRERARQLRENPTPVEVKLWKRLKGRGLGEYKFRRQHPIGRFIVDFYCHRAKLIVELDGGVHRGQQEYDEERSLWFERHGLKVIRFLNALVETEMESVLKAILKACEEG
ncbi:MAG: DUF559 domain-containing protein [Anaerolineae bacterium]|nr:DUF559 domain-containing protein [Anaerolineae bacterium]